MTKTHVVFLVSTPIDKDVINDNPKYIKFKVHIIPLLEYIQSDDIDALTNILPALFKRLKSYKPRIVIFHLGVAFDRYPRNYIKIIIALHNQFPTIIIGLDKGIKYIQKRIVATGLIENQLVLLLLNSIQVDENNADILLLNQALS
jgi:hypothetical protein